MVDVHWRPMIIQGFWTGPPLSSLHWACLKSFVACGHHFKLYSYDRLLIPEGVTLEDAREIVAADEIFYFLNSETNKADIAPFADYFRLKLLAERGGWYCDVDTICLRSSLPVGERIWARQCPEIDIDSVSNGQLYFEKGDPIARLLLTRCEKRRPHLERRESLGPTLISSVIKELSLPRDMGASADVFYPIRWIEIFKLWLPEFRQEIEQRVKEAVFLPIYQSFPAYVGLDPDKLPPEGSYLFNVLRRFAPGATGLCHHPDDVRELVRTWFRSKGSWALNWLAAIRGPSVVERLALR